MISPDPRLHGCRRTSGAPSGWLGCGGRDGLWRGFRWGCEASEFGFERGDAGVAAGRVAPLLRSFWPPAIPVSLIHQPRRTQPLKRRAFLDFVAPRLTAALANVEQAVSAP